MGCSSTTVVGVGCSGEVQALSSTKANASAMVMRFKLVRVEIAPDNAGCKLW